MRLITESYTAQEARWPQTGRHILAQYDAEKIVVYQAYRPEIGRYAAEQGYFGDGFSQTRMSWIKPNFLWMMFRCGWATKKDQETVLAVSIRREAFDAILVQAVPSAFIQGQYNSQAEWKQAAARSQVRLQWDPDHHPSGAKLERRAIQLGLRGDFLTRYAREWIVSIEDITDFVTEQSLNRDHTQLLMPREEVYPVSGDLAKHLGMAA